MKTKDEAIRVVRDAREKISAQFGNDPDKLVDHYMQLQERYRDRLLQPIAAHQRGSADDASRRR